jgi:hypothetical protein
VQETPNVILEERCENSPQKRAKDNPPNAAKNPEPKWTRIAIEVKKGAQNS